MSKDTRVYLIPSTPLCYDDYFTNMTAKHNKCFKPNYGMYNVAF
jgi:hypothetical protein